mmetsp:Transcript_66397/g.210133  ORF Transcript_66397/g.210133 Transcript_66397/m.210133 type:complete len:586 (+) Transcript_66397:4444-6201(+)
MSVAQGEGDARDVQRVGGGHVDLHPMVLRAVRVGARRAITDDVPRRGVAVDEDIGQIARGVPQVHHRASARGRAAVGERQLGAVRRKDAQLCEVQVVRAAIRAGSAARGPHGAVEGDGGALPAEVHRQHDPSHAGGRCGKGLRGAHGCPPHGLVVARDERRRAHFARIMHPGVDPNLCDVPVRAQDVKLHPVLFVGARVHRVRMLAQAHGCVVPVDGIARRATDETTRSDVSGAEQLLWARAGGGSAELQREHVALGVEHLHLDQVQEIMIIIYAPGLPRRHVVPIFRLLEADPVAVRSRRGGGPRGANGTLPQRRSPVPAEALPPPEESLPSGAFNGCHVGGAARVDAAERRPGHEGPRGPRAGVGARVELARWREGPDAVPPRRGPRHARRPGHGHRDPVRSPRRDAPAVEVAAGVHEKDLRPAGVCHERRPLRLRDAELVDGVRLPPPAGRGGPGHLVERHPRVGSPAELPLECPLGGVPGAGHLPRGEHVGCDLLGGCDLPRAPGQGLGLERVGVRARHGRHRARRVPGDLELAELDRAARPRGPRHDEPVRVVGAGGRAGGERGQRLVQLEVGEVHLPGG